MIPMQIVIFVVCTFLYYTGRTSGGGTLMVFAGMQIAALLGAWWGARIRKQIEGNDERLPLE